MGVFLWCLCPQFWHMVVLRRIRAAVRVARLFGTLAVIFVSGIAVSIAAAFAGGSTPAFGLGALGGFLWCLCPEFWNLVVLRIDDDQEGPIRVMDLRIGWRTRAEFVPQWHPDSAAAKRPA